MTCSGRKKSYPRNENFISYQVIPIYSEDEMPAIIKIQSQIGTLKKTQKLFGFSIDFKEFLNAGNPKKIRKITLHQLS